MHGDAMEQAFNSPQQIRSARNRLGLTQRELARRAGVAVHTVRDVELGRVRSPHPETLRRLLAACDATPRIHLLGMFAVEWAGEPLPIGSRLERSMLAVLALRPRQPLTREEIAAALWGVNPPRSWVNLIQTYASRLRRLLDPDAILFESGGYRLMIGPDRVDATLFQDLMARAAGGDHADALGLAERALRLWRGRLGSGLSPHFRQHPAVVELESSRAAAALRYAELAVPAGRPSEAATVLATVAAEHPTHPGVAEALARLLGATRTDGAHPVAAAEPGTGHLFGDAPISLAVLGTVSVTRLGRTVHIGGQLGRTVLAALALDPGRTVSVDRLAQLLWGDRPPRSARTQVHVQISRLRAILRQAGVADLIRTEPGGYSVRPERISTDLAAADDLILRSRTAAAAGRHAEAAEGFRRALELWQGTELNGVTEYLAEAVAARLADLRQDAAEERIAAELEHGSPLAVLRELDDLIRAHPLREELHRLRMLALHRSGRRAEALAAYGAAREVLRGELGLDPSPALRDLEAEILAHGADRPGPPGPVPVPAQLPPCAYGFAGRVDELARLREMLAGPTSTAGRRVIVLSGMPGIGKTALAVHVATRVSALFPDGQLFVELGGGSTARPTGAVLGDVLRSLGADPPGLPADLAGRVALLRTLTAGKRMLILLDDVATESQVEDLLPADPGCAVLITSRRVLPGLGVGHRLALAPLAAGPARQVLTAWAGTNLAAKDPDAVGDLVRVCAGVPLALRIVGARLAAFTHLTPAGVAGRMGDDVRRLDELVVGGHSVRASLDASHRLLSDDARAVLLELFRLGDLSATDAEVGARLGASVDDIAALTEELAGLHLVEITEPSADRGARYRLNGLVRAYLAAEPSPPVRGRRSAGGTEPARRACSPTARGKVRDSSATYVDDVRSATSEGVPDDSSVQCAR
ncbi:MAG: BTAD domain-containing putative transcriptional regulator [Actinocatenispora sp.]